MDNTTEQPTRIRELNDATRRTGPSSGRWMMTAGVAAEGFEFGLLATKAVQAFTAFTEDNDPYGEHDFGAFTLAGQRLFWEIDYYDKSLKYGSPDPADPTVTTPACRPSCWRRTTERLRPRCVPGSAGFISIFA
jgi:hypothetical protein